jgi:peptide/nickel transport system permease protein
LLAVLLLRVILDEFINSSSVKLGLSMVFFGFISSPRLANMIIGKIKRLRAEEFIQSAIVLGLSGKKIIFKHILWYECRYIILFQLAYIMGQATILEVTLTYFRYGANPPWYSWGLMLDNMVKFSERSLYLLFPVIFITVVIYFWMGLAEELKKAGEEREVSV